LRAKKMAELGLQPFRGREIENASPELEPPRLVVLASSGNNPNS
jgi:hypothetical protein